MKKIGNNLARELCSKPKDLISFIQTLPVHLYNCNILSEDSVRCLLQGYERINSKLDEELNLNLFMLKK